MKKLIAALSLVLCTSVAMAEEFGTEDVIARGGLTTIVGGCANAQIIGGGENTEIVYTGPCHSQPANVYRHNNDTIGKVWTTFEAAAAECNHDESVIGAYYWDRAARRTAFGYACVPYSNQNGGE